MQPNTFQGENGGDGHADPTSETPLAMASSVQDMLMFSDDDDETIRVFQGIPSSVYVTSTPPSHVSNRLPLSDTRAHARTVCCTNVPNHIFGSLLLAGL